ncbi:Dabb family protein [Myxococcota bacterium]|nr:Dabb family protein [Myxococcota bacterium]
MVERHVYLKLHEQHVPAREALARTCRQRLLQVPGVQAVAVGVAADAQSARSWDLCLQIRFADLEAMEAYVPHPAHQAFLAEVLEPVTAFKKAWSFTPLS